MTTISFPGLGIEAFEMNPIAFTIPIFGGLDVHWYGLIIAVGMLLAFLYVGLSCRREQVKLDDILDIGLFAVVFGIIGARLYYVLTSDHAYNSFKEVIAIWNGGLAIYGGIIAGALTIYVCCRHKKISFLKVFDLAAPAVILAQAIGRWGNFVNGEAYGTALTESSPLYFLRMGLLPNIDSRFMMHYYHPTFLYESVWNLLGFALLALMARKKKFDGQICYMYMAWYGLGRMVIEGLRVDSLYVGVFRISQVVAFISFVIGSVLFVVTLLNTRREEQAKMAYEAAYPKLSRMNAEQDAAADEGQTNDEDGSDAAEETEDGEDLSEEDEDPDLFEDDDNR